MQLIRKIGIEGYSERELNIRIEYNKNYSAYGY